MFGKPDDLIPFADDIFDTIFIGIRCLEKNPVSMPMSPSKRPSDI
jgi:hypothetical protein